uniref:Uncharacterized protein n=1 Tax=Oryza punctata TaxID=4537 RepID=A0A0E0LEZ0_ORYPU
MMAAVTSLVFGFGNLLELSRLPPSSYLADLELIWRLGAHQIRSSIGHLFFLPHPCGNSAIWTWA